MDDLIKGILIGLIPALVVALITSWLTVTLSMKQFYSQRWWERKSDSYSTLMERLSNFQFFVDEWIYVLNTNGLNTESKERVTKGYREGLAALENMAALGSYFVSDVTANTLSKLIANVYENEWDGDFSAEALQDSFEAIKECIKIVRNEARKDLGIK